MKKSEAQYLLKIRAKNPRLYNIIADALIRGIAGEVPKLDKDHFGLTRAQYDLAKSTLGEWNKICSSTSNRGTYVSFCNSAKNTKLGGDKKGPENVAETVAKRAFHRATDKWNSLLEDRFDSSVKSAWNGRGGLEGKSLKNILVQAYEIWRISKEKGRPVPEDPVEAVLALWGDMLAAWDKWDPFHKKSQLSFINKFFIDIYNHLKKRDDQRIDPKEFLSDSARRAAEYFEGKSSTTG